MHAMNQASAPTAFNALRAQQPCGTPPACSYGSPAFNWKQHPSSTTPAPLGSEGYDWHAYSYASWQQGAVSAAQPGQFGSPAMAQHSMAAVQQPQPLSWTQLDYDVSITKEVFLSRVQEASDTNTLNSICQSYGDQLYDPEFFGAGLAVLSRLLQLRDASQPSGKPCGKASWGKARDFCCSRLAAAITADTHMRIGCEQLCNALTCAQCVQHVGLRDVSKKALLSSMQHRGGMSLQLLVNFTRVCGGYEVWLSEWDVQRLLSAAVAAAEAQEKAGELQVQQVTELLDCIGRCQYLPMTREPREGHFAKMIQLVRPLEALVVRHFNTGRTTAEELGLLMRACGGSLRVALQHLPAALDQDCSFAAALSLSGCSDVLCGLASCMRYNSTAVMTVLERVQALLTTTTAAQPAASTMKAVTRLLQAMAWLLPYADHKSRICSLACEVTAAGLILVQSAPIGLEAEELNQLYAVLGHVAAAGVQLLPTHPTSVDSDQAAAQSSSTSEGAASLPVQQQPEKVALEQLHKQQRAGFGACLGAVVTNRVLQAGKQALTETTGSKFEDTCRKCLADVIAPFLDTFQVISPGEYVITCPGGFQASVDMALHLTNGQVYLVQADGPPHGIAASRTAAAAAWTAIAAATAAACKTAEASQASGSAHAAVGPEASSSAAAASAATAAATASPPPAASAADAAAASAATAAAAAAETAAVTAESAATETAPEQAPAVPYAGSYMMPNAKTVARNYLHRLAGFKVVCIPSWLFMPYSDEQRLVYMVKLLGSSLMQDLAAKRLQAAELKGKSETAAAEAAAVWVLAALARTDVVVMEY